MDSYRSNKSKCNIGSITLWDAAQANNSGSGFPAVTWLRHAQDHSDVKAGPEMSPHTFNRDGSWQSEGMVIDGAFSTSCIQQTKNKCLPGTMLLPNMSLSSVWGQLWNTDSCYSQDRWDGVKSPSSYELWIEETQIVYGYPRYMNGHLRWHVLEFACVVFTTTHSN